MAFKPTTKHVREHPYTKMTESDYLRPSGRGDGTSLSVSHKYSAAFEGEEKCEFFLPKEYQL